MSHRALQQLAAQQLAGDWHLPTSLWRARRVCSQIIHKNELAATVEVLSIPDDLAVFRLQADSGQTPASLNLRLK